MSALPAVLAAVAVLSVASVEAAIAVLPETCKTRPRVAPSMACSEKAGTHDGFACALSLGGCAYNATSKAGVKACFRLDIPRCPRSDVDVAISFPNTAGAPIMAPLTMPSNKDYVKQCYKTASVDLNAIDLSPTANEFLSEMGITATDLPAGPTRTTAVTFGGQPIKMIAQLLVAGCDSFCTTVSQASFQSTFQRAKVSLKFECSGLLADLGTSPIDLGTFLGGKDCAALKDCGSCAAAVGCGWCGAAGAGGRCVAGDRNGPTCVDCTPIASWQATKCAVGGLVSWQAGKGGEAAASAAGDYSAPLSVLCVALLGLAGYFAKELRDMRRKVVGHEHEELEGDQMM